MFTGIITDIGCVKEVSNQEGDWRFRILTSYLMSSVDIGASISCSGCCLTVVEKADDSFDVEVSGETLSKTHLKDWSVGTRMNLERALKAGDELGGHIVSGHVDSLATLDSITRDRDSHRLSFTVPDEFAGFIAPKGSVALDGISLTVNEVEGSTFGVNIIPHTWDNTTLGDRIAGDVVHLEIDMMARYIARMLEVSQ